LWSLPTQRTELRVLVTGGAGFLGSHLCERLLTQGAHVICLDNFFSGRLENIEHLRANPRFELVRHDVTEPVALEVDQIYNLACPASPIHFRSHPLETMRASVLGAVHLLALATRTGARLLQASTAEVYGEPHVHPQPESYWGHVNPTGPRACYDEGKRAAEALFTDCHRSLGTDTRIARIFNTYGSRMAEWDGRVVASFVLQALRGEELTIYGEGRQTRSFCYVDDMVDGLIRLMAADGRHEPVNLGNPHEFTIRQLADAVARAVGRELRLAFRPLPQDDPTQRCPDIGRARAWLGWEPKVGLEEGLRETVAYYRTHITASRPPSS
jgi:UDP-glucuronate decarboxylase